MQYQNKSILLNFFYYINFNYLQRNVLQIGGCIHQRTIKAKAGLYPNKFTDSVANF